MRAHLSILAKNGQTTTLSLIKDYEVGNLIEIDGGYIK